MAALWAEYNAILGDLEQGRIDRATCHERLVKLCPRADELLRYSASVTSSVPNVWGQIVGGAAVATLTYADVALQVAAAGDPGLHEAAQLAHQAAVKLFESREAPSESAVDRALFSQYFASLSLGRLPPEYAGREDWHRYVVPSTVFSQGESIVTMGDVLKEVQPVAGYFDVKAGRYARGLRLAGRR